MFSIPIHSLSPQGQTPSCLYQAVTRFHQPEGNLKTFLYSVSFQTKNSKNKAEESSSTAGAEDENANVVLRPQNTLQQKVS